MGVAEDETLTCLDKRGDVTTMIESTYRMVLLICGLAAASCSNAGDESVQNVAILLCFLLRASDMYEVSPETGIHIECQG